MTQLTVRGIDAQLHKALKEDAQKRGVSVNRIVLDALRQMAGLEQPRGQRPMRHHDLDHLAGAWTEAEFEEFQAAIEQQRTIDPELW